MSLQYSNRLAEMRPVPTALTSFKGPSDSPTTFALRSYMQSAATASYATQIFVLVFRRTLSH
jgi:hypothetical protein